MVKVSTTFGVGSEKCVKLWLKNRLRSCLGRPVGCPARQTVGLRSGHSRDRAKRLFGLLFPPPFPCLPRCPMSEVIKAIQNRTSIPRLKGPAPDRVQLQTLFECAVRAPDHGRMRPWRFVVMEGEALQRLGQAFEAAGVAGDPAADEAKRARWREMPLRAPMIIAAIARIQPNPKVPDWEQVAAVATAVQNIQLAARELGFGTMWRTGEMTVAPAVKEHLGMAAADQVVAFLYIGTPEGENRAPEFQPLEQCVEYRN